MKIQKIGLTALSVLLLYSCAKEEVTTPSKDTSTVSVSDTKNSQNTKTPFTIEQINNYINTQLEKGEYFSWSEVSDRMLWSAVYHGGGILTVGYGSTTATHFREHSTPTLEKLKTKICSIASKSEGFTRAEDNYLEYDVINVLDIKVNSLETIRELRLTEGVRYLEPNGYDKFISNTTDFRFSDGGGSGCSTEGESIDPNDYTLITPNNAQVSWNYYYHNIPAAWNYSTGKNVAVGLVDTGLSASQSLLTSENFNSGDSYGRKLEKYGTFKKSSWWWGDGDSDGPDDKCGHGTSMGAVIASPRNAMGMPVGVAYNSNLIAYRATEDVVLNDYDERKGVSDAIIALANRDDIKVISMSIGYLWSIGIIEDAIKYAYSKGKLIVAAAGTSTVVTQFYGVIFPANMTETVAVTGIQNRNTYEECNVCHYGDEVDFTVVMQDKDNYDKRTVCLSFYERERSYVGGSSVATAMTAGIAALVWGRYPNWTRDRVLQRLKESAEFYPNKDDKFGYGNIDALKAVQ